MNPENTKILLENFPDLYKDLDWGFECRDGWFPLLLELSKQINDEIQPSDRNIYRAAQVKSKFGRLRYYMTTSSYSIDSIIFQAEADSGVICETCGSPAILKQECGWFRTACEKH